MVETKFFNKAQSCVLGLLKGLNFILPEKSSDSSVFLLAFRSIEYKKIENLFRCLKNLTVVKYFIISGTVNKCQVNFGPGFLGAL